MRAFEAQGAVAVALIDAEERLVLARLVADVGRLLAGEEFEEAPVEQSTDPMAALVGLEKALADPQDPAVLRLLPSAFPEDPELAGDFRRFTEPDLRSLKTARLRRMWEDLSAPGETWEVAQDDALPTAAALTDVRLVLASRLELVTDEDAEHLHVELEQAHEAIAKGVLPSLEGERLWLGMLYQALTWLQESLMSYVMRDDV